MQKFIVTLFLTAGLGSLAFAQQPSINAGGIVNVASYTPSALPGSAIAQGSIFAIFGANLGPPALQSSGAFPLPKTLGGTSVKITSGGVTTDAVLFYTSAGQVAAILPSTVAVGSATLTVAYNGQTSAPAPFQVTVSSFGAFTANSAGSGPAAITDGNNKINSFTNAFNPGDTVVLYGTGLGPVSGNEAAQPLPGDLTSVPVQVYMGVTPATVTYRGRSGCCAALDQINFTVPNIAAGCRVPLSIKIGNNVSNFPTVAIAAAGSRTCSDPNGPTPSDLAKYSQNGVAVGAVTLVRVSATVSSVPGFGNITANVDSGAASFYKYTPALLNSAQNPFNTASTSACTVSSYKGGAAPGDPILPKTLDAGASINITGPNGSKPLNKTTVAGITSYLGVFGTTTGGLPGVPSTPGFLDPGTYTATGPGGADIGAFTATMTVPQPLQWTNQDAITSVTRAQGQLITWTGGDPTGTVQIVGSSATGTDANAYTVTFMCSAPASARQFSIPSLVLLALPPSAVISGTPTGTLLVGSVNTPKLFTATGLDTGVFVSTVDAAKTLNFQ